MSLKISGPVTKQVADRKRAEHWVIVKEGNGSANQLQEEQPNPFAEYSRRSLAGCIAKMNRQYKNKMVMGARPGAGVAEVLASTRRGGTVEAVGSTLGKYFFSNDVETASID
jgi:hypothetical protein